MKKPILSIIFIILFSASCSQSYILDIPEYYTLDSIDAIIEFIWDNVEYCLDWDSEKPSLNRWQSPKQTLELGTGDCDDFTVLFMYLCYVNLDMRPDMMLVFVIGGTLHYICVYDGILYDPTNRKYGDNFRYEFILLDKISYDVTMDMATVFYTRNLQEENNDRT